MKTKAQLQAEIVETDLLNAGLTNKLRETERQLAELKGAMILNQSALRDQADRIESAQRRLQSGLTKARDLNRANRGQAEPAVELIFTVEDTLALLKT